MTYFIINGDETSRERYSFQGSHKWSLPGVRCHVCGWVGATTGAAYPRILLPPGLPPAPYQSYSPIGPDALESLLAPIKPLVPRGLPTGAGMEFGPLIGTCSGRPDDISWMGISNLLVSDAALARLLDRGVGGLVGVRTEITQSKPNGPFRHLELDVEAKATWHPECMADTSVCDACGARRFRIVETDGQEKPVLLSTSMPEGTDLARVRGGEHCIIATERLVEAVRSLRLQGLSFEEVPAAARA